MKKRTEDQIIDNSGLSMTFNGKSYSFKELNIRKTKDWMRKFTEKDGSVLTAVVEAAEAKQKQEILASMGYDNLCSLVSDYTEGAVTVEQIEEGTTKELETAFNQVVRLAGFFDLAWGKTGELRGEKTN